MIALEPLKMTESNNGGSYAYQRRMEWYLVGPIGNMSCKDSLGCHCIGVQDAISSKIAEHHFVVEETTILLLLKGNIRSLLAHHP